MRTKTNVELQLIPNRTIMQKKQIFEENTSHNYEINPYINCAHNCIYCFVKYKNGKEPQSQNKVTPKTDLPEALEQYIAKLKVEELPESVFFSSQTDPYQPLEAEYKITRQCLEVLSNYPIKVEILTKSDIVLRDIDLLSKINSQVFVSFCISDDLLQERIEPKASSITQRLDLIKKLYENNIKVGVKLKPILPFFFTEPETIIKMIEQYINDKIYIQGMLYGNEAIAKIETIAKKYYPNKYSSWQNLEKRENFYEQTLTFLKQHELVELLPVKAEFKKGDAKSMYSEYGFY